MTDKGTPRKSMSGGHSAAPLDYAAERQRQAVEVRQYKEIMAAVHAAARAYTRRTGARLNQTDTTPEDIAADTYIIARETPQRPGEAQLDHMRRAAYEAVRRATRAQQRHAHTDTPEDRDDAAQADADLLEAVAVRQAIQQAGHVASLLAQGYTPADISRRLRVSPSTAWRLANRAREQIKQALDMDQT
mgnify:CR=1 FL=1